MKILLRSSKKNYICTIVIGKKIYENWEKFTLPFLKKYCIKNNIGLIIFTKDLIDPNSIYWKKATWQKLLVGDFLIKNKNKIDVKNICIMDVDILTNPNAPNIFDFHNDNKISVISLRNNLPFNWDKVVRKVSFYRNRFYSKKYPLDSAINISLKNLYKNHNLPPQKDEFCAGLYVFTLKKFHKIFKKWFFKYDKKLYSITGGGEQTHFNFEVQRIGKANFLNYKFQSIWVFEMAHYYPFLYKIKNKKSKIITDCIINSLNNNYFLHFAGSWHESEMWKNLNIKKYYFQKKELSLLQKYLESKLSGKPAGMIKPPK